MNLVQSAFGCEAHLAHPDLPHQLVLVSVHASELSHMGEGVLQAICQLESIYIAQPELDIGVHHQLGQPQNLSAQMECIAKPGLLPLLGGQGLHWLQVEVVVQMQVVEVLAMNQQIEHVVALPTDLQRGKAKSKSMPCNLCSHFARSRPSQRCQVEKTTRDPTQATQVADQKR